LIRSVRARRDQLACELTFVPAPPPPTTLRQVAEHVNEIIGAGTHAHHDANHDLVIAGDLLPVRLLNPRDQKVTG
jgi:hypothetical protein